MQDPPCLNVVCPDMWSFTADAIELQCTYVLPSRRYGLLRLVALYGSGLSREISLYFCVLNSHIWYNLPIVVAAPMCETLDKKKAVTKLYLPSTLVSLCLSPSSRDTIF